MNSCRNLQIRNGQSGLGPRLRFPPVLARAFSAGARSGGELWQATANYIGHSRVPTSGSNPLSPDMGDGWRVQHKPLIRRRIWLLKLNLPITEATPTMVDIPPVLPGLSPLQGKAVVARFDGGRLSSEGGLLLLREIETPA